MPLSEAHREFLLAFGENGGGLFEADDFDTSLVTVQAYSRDYLNDYGARACSLGIFASCPAGFAPPWWRSYWGASRTNPWRDRDEPDRRPITLPHEGAPLELEACDC